VFQAALQHLREGLNLANDELEILETTLFARQRGDLAIEVLQTFLGVPEPRFPLGSINQPILVRIDQTAHASLDFLSQGFQLIQTAVTRGSGQASLVFAGNPLGFLEQGTAVLPDRLFQQVCANLPVVAQALSPEPVRVAADAPIVGVGSSLAFGGATADGFTVVGMTTSPTDEQALQQIPGASPSFSLSPAVLLELVLNRIK
jgi:hypothetical protein